MRLTILLVPSSTLLCTTLPVRAVSAITHLQSLSCLWGFISPHHPLPYITDICSSMNSGLVCTKSLPLYFTYPHSFSFEHCLLINLYSGLQLCWPISFQSLYHSCRPSAVKVSTSFFGGAVINSIAPMLAASECFLYLLTTLRSGFLFLIPFACLTELVIY